MTEHITIGDVSPRVQYAADGAQTQFTYPFPIFEDSDLKVWFDDTEQTSGFTVSGAGNSSGGTVDFDTPPATGVTITLRREVPIERTTDFQEGGAFRAKTINDELNRQTAMIQQIAETGDRTLQVPPTDDGAGLTLPPKASRAGKFLKFDEDGKPMATGAVDAGAVIEGNGIDISDGVVSVDFADHLVSLDRGTDIDDDDIDGANVLTLPADGNSFHFDGTQQVDAITSVGIGTSVRFVFASTRQLTHDATDLVLPGGANITTAVGDVAEFYEYAAGAWRCTAYLEAPMTQAQAEAGTDMIPRKVAAAQIAQAIAALGSSGGVTVIASGSHSGPTLDFEQASIFDGTYSRIEIELTGIVPATDDVQLYLRVKDGIYRSGAADYVWSTLNQAGSSPNVQYSTADSQIQLTDDAAATAGLGISATDFADFVISTFRPNTAFPAFRCQGFYRNAQARPCVLESGGQYVGMSNTISGIRLFAEGDANLICDYIARGYD